MSLIELRWHVVTLEPKWALYSRCINFLVSTGLDDDKTTLIQFGLQSGSLGQNIVIILSIHNGHENRSSPVLSSRVMFDVMNLVAETQLKMQHRTTIHRLEEA